MKVEVTKRHIQKGVRVDANECPIALALKNEKFSAKVDATCLILDLKSGQLLVDLPSSAKKFIRRFDKGKSVKPFTFKLPIRVCVGD